jgi:hypothetical protein
VPGAPLRAPGRADGVARGISFVLPLLTLTACFDVKQVDPGPQDFLIDDFEDGDAVPKTSLFGHWGCFSYNPDTGQDPLQTVSCDLEPQPGDQSAFALLMRFKLHESVSLYPGASLATFAPNTAADLTGYRALSFNIRVELSDPFPPDPTFHVELGCNSVTAETQDDQEYFDLDQRIAPTDKWTPKSLLLSNFTQRTDETNHFAGGPQACLAVVDSIRFEITGSFTSGQSGSGVIHIDDVRLQK